MLHVAEQLQTIGGDALIVDPKRAASRRLVPLDDVVLDELARPLERFPAAPTELVVGKPVGSARQAVVVRRRMASDREASRPVGRHSVP